MSVIALQVIWGLVSVLHLLALFYVIRFLTLRVHMTLDKATSTQSNWKKAQMVMLSRFTALGVLAGQFHIAFSLLGFFHALDVTHVLGRDITVTLLWAWGTVAFWSWTVLQTSNFIIVNTAQARMNLATGTSIKNAWTRLKVTGAVMEIFAVGAAMAPIIMLGSDDANTIYGLACMHYGCSITCILLVFYFLSSGIRPLKLEIQAVLNKGTNSSGSPVNSDASRDAPLKKAVTNIAILLREASRALFMQAILCIAFCVPWMSTRSGYFQATSWLTALPPMFVGTFIITPKTSTASSARQLASGSKDIVAPRGNNNSSSTGGNKLVSYGSAGNVMGSTVANSTT